MDQDRQQARPPLDTYEALAKMIDHAVLRPEWTEEQAIGGCELARRYGVASVTVRPCDVDVAVRNMENGGVTVGSVSGFPNGDQNTATKLYETRDLLRRGAKEIDLTANVSKLLSRQFQYVEMEILQAAEACHKAGARLKVIVDNSYLTEELKIVACRICARAEVDFVVTSLGGAKMIRANLPDDVQLKTAGIDTLENTLEAYQLGCSRIGTSDAAAILNAWKAELAANHQPRP